MNRPYQDAALSAIRTEYGRGITRQLVSMATGTGKTWIFGQLPSQMPELPGQMMILNHRDELLEQSIKTARLLNPTLKVTKEMGEDYADPDADIIVASVATIGRTGTKRLERFNCNRIDKLVTDEAHHSTAPIYKNVYEQMGVLRDGNDKLLLGVTATSRRGDSCSLAEIYQKIVFVYDIRQAIEEGWLVDVQGIRVETDTSLDSVPTLAGDFSQGILADTVNTPARNEMIVDAWVKYGEERQTVIFAASVAHAIALAQRLRARGTKSEAIWGEDPLRKEKLEQHKAGGITVLTNFGILTEGYDDWRIGCIVLARPTKSPVLFTQMIGRGTRLEEGTGNLREVDTWDRVKRNCIIIDVCDSTFKHNLVTLPSLLGMSSKLNLQGRSVIQAAQLIENAQLEHPTVDFSTLEDITKLKTFVSQVNLLNSNVPDEIAAVSKLTWHRSASGGYVLAMPQKNIMRIIPNLLDKYEICGNVLCRSYKGVRDTLEEAVAIVDELVADKLPSYMYLVKAEEPWRQKTPSKKQMTLLKRLYKGRPIPNNLTKGDAANLITQFLSRKS